MEPEYRKELKEFYNSIATSEEERAILIREQKSFNRAYDLMINAKSKKRKKLLKHYLTISFEEVEVMNRVIFAKISKKISEAEEQFIDQQS